MAIQRLRVEWSGSAIDGAGVTTLFGEADGTTALYAAFNQLLGQCLSLLAPDLTITVPQSGDVLDEATGTLTGTWGSGAPAVHNTAGTTNYARGVGARIVWGTSAIHAGRRVRGSTFLCPLKSTAYDGTGSLTTTAVTDLQAGVDAYLIAMGARGRVWSRPTTSRPGIASAVTSGFVPDEISWLRSRRV